MLAKRTKLQPLHRRTDSFKKARKLTHELFFDKKTPVCHFASHVPHPPVFNLNAKFQLYSMRQRKGRLWHIGPNLLILRHATFFNISK